MENELVLSVWNLYLEEFWHSREEKIYRRLHTLSQLSKSWNSYELGIEEALQGVLEALKHLELREPEWWLILCGDSREGEYGKFGQYAQLSVPGDRNMFSWIVRRLKGVEYTQLRARTAGIAAELSERKLYPVFDQWIFSILLWAFNPEMYAYFTRNVRARFFADLLGWAPESNIFRKQKRADAYMEPFFYLTRELLDCLQSMNCFAELPFSESHEQFPRVQMTVLSDFMDVMGRFLNTDEGKIYLHELKTKPNAEMLASKRKSAVIPRQKVTLRNPSGGTTKVYDIPGVTYPQELILPSPGAVVGRGAEARAFDGETMRGPGYPLPDFTPGPEAHAAAETSQRTIDESDEESGADVKEDPAQVPMPETANGTAEEPWDESRGGMNLIVFGAPGVGKSTYIRKEILKNVPDSRVRRVVFHPDYTNAEFVGQLLPKGEGQEFSYRFEPGPFCLSLRDAEADSEHHHYLVVEEINRGHAAAIFGEVFQLLDRDENGRSRFAVAHPEAAARIYPEQKGAHDIRIPANLSLIATMNSADQNVGTLDNAFLRRWRMHLVENNFMAHREHSNRVIDDTGVTWGHFCKVVNRLITENDIGMLSTDDKRLGVYFMNEGELSAEQGAHVHPVTRRLHSRLFAAKVLRYLWDDVFRLNRSTVFSVSTFEEVMHGYMNPPAGGASRFDVLSERLRQELTQKGE